MEVVEVEQRLSLLQFLIDCSCMETIQRQCYHHLLLEDQHEQTKIAVCKVTLVIDVSLLLQSNAILGDILLNRPKEGWEMFHDVIYMTIKEMEWMPRLSSKTQLMLLLRLKGLPESSKYCIRHISELPCVNEEMRFVSCTGVVSSISSRDEYTESAVFNCCNIRCKSTSHIRYHIAGSSESTTIKDNLSCPNCDHLLVEDLSYRTLADKVSIVMIPSEAFKLSHLNVRYQGFNIVLRDDLCQKVELGGEYTVIGVPINTPHHINGRITIDTIIEANNVLTPVNDVSRSTNAISGHVKDLYDACQYSSWTFTATLAYSLGNHIVPCGTFHRLKLALLLSLAAARGPRDKMIDVLAIGEEMDCVRSLMEYVTSSFGQRGMKCIMLNNTTRTDDCTEWTDGSSLLLSKNGICLLGNVTRWKKDDKEQLQHIMETGKVSVKSNKRTSSTTEPVTTKLQCTMWMSCDHHVTNNNNNNNKHLHEQIGVSKGLIDQVGLVLVTDPISHGDHVTHLMTNHILQKSSGSLPSQLLTTQDFTQILSVATSIPVELHPSANDLLKGYYVTSRRVRGNEIPLTALNTMISLALSHARLNMRCTATVDDATLAILLYEESLVYKYGHSTLYVQPCQHFIDDNLTRYIGKELRFSPAQMARL